ncbi:MAG: transketolase [Flavobacteriales bacterium 32-34-25]|nr:MAG: transketolase [Flavobacteriales bacterium 32-34-25]
MHIENLKRKSIESRKKILKYIYNAKAGHTGGSLSILDILNVLYNDVMNVSPENFSSNTRDRFIQSKGHPTKAIHGIEQNTGGLGHGLPICAGAALAAKKDNSGVKVFTILGDGEMAEGSNWEAMMFAAHYKLDNLCAILDYNKLQITAPNEDVMGLEPIDQKLESFGWAVKHVDGHNLEELSQTLNNLPLENGKPTFIIAHTTKGKGISYMENVLKWHHGVPSKEQYDLAIEELDLQLQELETVSK